MFFAVLIPFCVFLCCWMVILSCSTFFLPSTHPPHLISSSFFASPSPPGRTPFHPPLSLSPPMYAMPKEKRCGKHRGKIKNTCLAYPTPTQCQNDRILAPYLISISEEQTSYTKRTYAKRKGKKEKKEKQNGKRYTRREQVYGYLEGFSLLGPAPRSSQLFIR